MSDGLSALYAATQKVESDDARRAAARFGVAAVSAAARDVTQRGKGSIKNMRSENKSVRQSKQSKQSRQSRQSRQ